jgi:hypothetical protein
MYPLKVSTLWGGVQNYCHIVLFFRGRMFELQPFNYYESLSQFLHIMIGQKPNKSSSKKITPLNLIMM